jgi:hypothetical protein
LGAADRDRVVTLTWETTPRDAIHWSASPALRACNQTRQQSPERDSLRIRIGRG